MIRPRIGVVGGSIAGCLTAAALTHAGYEAVVLERSPEKLQDRGAGVALPLAVLDQLTASGLLDRGVAGPPPTAREWRVPDKLERFGRLVFSEPLGGAAMLHWSGLFQNLRRRVRSGSYVEGAAVVSVVSRRDDVLVACEDGSRYLFDLLVGADGYRSSIRRLLFGAEPRYAGYPAWRGIVEEGAVSDPWFVEGRTQQVGVSHGHAVIYLVPGPCGELTAGKRNVNWLIYDGAAPRDVAGVSKDSSGRLVGATVAAGQLSAEQLEYLRCLADAHLPPWHRDLIYATPRPYLQSLYDLRLERFVKGRICLVGDAASLARPHTGSGASKAIQDGLALTQALRSSTSIDDALRRYESERMPAGNALVELGRALGHDQVVDAPDWPRLSGDGYRSLLLAGAASRTYFGSGSLAASSTEHH
jgi:2-polyprenyl-6-methoxyphenol hydroxylase-like FAD-dependent oxidoreductase